MRIISYIKHNLRSKSDKYLYFTCPICKRERRVNKEDITDSTCSRCNANKTPEYDWVWNIEEMENK